MLRSDNLLKECTLTLKLVKKRWLKTKVNDAVKLVQRERSCFGYCDHHEEVTEEVTYRYKGCWGCQHFEFGKTFPYIFVLEVAEKLKVSESTVRRLIKKGKLEGELFEQQRRTRSLPSPSKYHISKESLKKILRGQLRRTPITSSPRFEPKQVQNHC